MYIYICIYLKTIWTIALCGGAAFILFFLPFFPVQISNTNNLPEKAEAKLAAFYCTNVVFCFSDFFFFALFPSAQFLHGETRVPEGPDWAAALWFIAAPCKVKKLLPSRRSSSILIRWEWEAALGSAYTPPSCANQSVLISQNLDLWQHDSGVRKTAPFPKPYWPNKQSGGRSLKWLQHAACWCFPRRPSSFATSEAATQRRFGKRCCCLFVFCCLSSWGLIPDSSVAALQL